MGRRFTAALAFGALAVFALASAPSGASASQEASFVSKINAERSEHGLGTVVVRSDLVQVARDWSAQMVADGAISHDPNVTQKVSGWTMLGDNVGRGATVSQLHTAFMNSEVHRDIVLDPGFNQVGVGIAMDGDTIYVTQIFVRRATSSPPSAPAPSAPAPVVRRAAPRPISSIAGLTGRIWSVELEAQPVTVDMLMRLVALDRN